MNPTYDAFTGKFMVLNGRVVPCTTFDFNTISDSPSVYEVLRVMQGKPLFLEDHMDRLENSMKFLCDNFSVSYGDTARQILQLSQANQTMTGNVKLIVSCGEKPENQESRQIIICFIPHHYPTPGEYELGISMQTLELERPNPNAKFINIDVTKKVNELKRKTGVDEVLLVNHEGEITEGSKSNIFFVRDDKVITPPKKLVLPGITREKIIESCKLQRIKLVEQNVKKKDLENVSGAFITGTSPKVMPVRQIDDLKFRTDHPLIRQIKNQYDQMINAHLSEFTIEKLSK